MSRVVLAMSGGVDSSASAWLLQQQGHEVIGLFMRSGSEATACATPSDNLLPIVDRRPSKQGCCSASDAADARRVADALDIPFHALNFREEFGRIKDYFADEYLAGRTPNPCVMCNVWLKFGKLWEFAESVGAEYIATGHYARVMPISRSPPEKASIAARDSIGGEGRGEGQPQIAGSSARERASPRVRSQAGAWERGDDGSATIFTPHPGTPWVPLPRMESDSSTERFAGERGRTPALYRGLDPTKDQSYVLFGIRRELLDRILFPVGDRTKSDIREMSRQAGIRTADKPDSQEICFIPDHDYATFVAQHRGQHETAGEFVDTAGNVLGQHAGYERFTIGQRKGLGITFGAPRYVVQIDAVTHRVVLGEKADLARTTLEADRLNLLVDQWPEEFRCTVQIRYQHQAAACTVERIDADVIRATFDEPQYGVTPGQALVLYDGDRVLGGGWIR
jgi:tRNA U34 2-thiouridine synthase MnmA/TrmU